MNSNTESKKTLLKAFEETIENFTGRTIEEIRNETIDEMIRRVKKEKGEYKLNSEFPLIGRGNVHSDNLITNEEIEKELDDLLKE